MNLTALEVPRKGKVQNIKAPLDLRRKKSCSGTEAPWTLSDGPYGRGSTVAILKFLRYLPLLGLVSKLGYPSDLRMSTACSNLSEPVIDKSKFPTFCVDILSKTFQKTNVL